MEPTANAVAAQPVAVRADGEARCEDEEDFEFEDEDEVVRCWYPPVSKVRTWIVLGSSYRNYPGTIPRTASQTRRAQC